MDRTRATSSSNCGRKLSRRKTAKYWDRFSDQQRFPCHTSQQTRTRGSGQYHANHKAKTATKSARHKQPAAVAESAHETIFTGPLKTRASRRAIPFLGYACRIRIWPGIHEHERGAQTAVSKARWRCLVAGWLREAIAKLSGTDCCSSLAACVPTPAIQCVADPDYHTRVSLANSITYANTSSKPWPWYVRRKTCVFTIRAGGNLEETRGRPGFPSSLLLVRTEAPSNVSRPLCVAPSRSGSACSGKRHFAKKERRIGTLGEEQRCVTHIQHLAVADLLHCVT